MVADARTPPLWLGLDLSTQSLTLVLLPDEPGGAHVYLDSISYAEDLPQYNTEHGMHISDGDDGEKNAVVTSPVTMWLEAIDMALSRLADLKSPPSTAESDTEPGTATKTEEQDGTDRTTWGRSALSRVRALSVSGQQHGTVFWKEGAAEKLDGLAELGPRHTLVEALGDCFARRDCPIWADSSTAKECDRLEAALGGPKAVAEATGSAAYCRFSGNQIARIARREPEAYARCERVSLVSSFVTSLLAGKYCPIDASDASGMNLMDIRSRDWHEGALAASNAKGLREKLGGVCASHECQGKVSGFFSRKYGLNPKCMVVSGSGDNPCGLAGLGLSGEGPVVVSLGTSDTVMGITKEPRPQEEGHVMVNPVEAASCFAILVYKNGSLGRQRLRDQLCSGRWEEFGAKLASTPPGNGGRIGLFVDMPEITPQIATVGTFRRGPADEVVEEVFSPEEEVRAMVEGRFLSMRGRLLGMGIPPPEAVLATGGGTNSPEIMQVLADVFNAPVFLKTVPDAAAIGAALRAKHGYLCNVQDFDKESGNSSPSTQAQPNPDHGSTDSGSSGSRNGVYVPFSRVLGRGAVPSSSPGVREGGTGDEGREGMRLAATPRRDAGIVYEGMAERYRTLEAHVKAIDRPAV